MKWSLKNSVFECFKCGECCRINNPIILTFDDVEKIILNFGTKEKKNIERVQLKDIRHNLTVDENRLKNGYHAIFEGYKFIQTKPCKYLDEKTDQCKIYDSRPKNCSWFPIVPKEMMRNGKFPYSINYYCPGEFLYHIQKVVTLIFIICEKIQSLLF